VKRLDMENETPIINFVTEFGVLSLIGQSHAQLNSYFAATQPSYVLRYSVTGFSARRAAGLL